ncbi:hypothetical protein D3C71_738800 [compost metagenome]|jgi:hypothetical protein
MRLTTRSRFALIAIADVPVGDVQGPVALPKSTHSLYGVRYGAATSSASFL